MILPPPSKRDTTEGEDLFNRKPAPGEYDYGFN
jgi:hypothetical protein